jgi:mRNA interferase MazF
MARFVKGDVVVVPFPFSNLQEAKRRPALVVSPLDGDDLILCQITSRSTGDRYAVSLEERDFQSGSLKQSSNIRPNRLFTADQAIVLYRAGSIAGRKVEEVVDRLIQIVRA